MTSRYGLQIRTATSADAPGIAELMEATGQPTAVPALASRIEALRDGSGTALLALEWGPPSGLIVLGWFRTLDADQPVARIGALLVGPDERRRGVGRLLLKAAAQAARVAGCGMLHLSAPAGDPGMRAFCDANGFTRTGAIYARPLRKKNEET